MIDVSKYTPAAVLAALYNASGPVGLGFLHFDPKPMSEEEAAAILGPSKRGYFDYLKGRVLKVEIGEATLDPRLYDRDNGSGAAARAIASINGA